VEKKARDFDEMMERKVAQGKGQPRGDGPREKDEHRLQQRQKQIEFGKNTIGYDNYTKKIPKARRKRGDPQTPDKYDTCSKRAWDGRVKVWRRALHDYDTPAPAAEQPAPLDEIPSSLPPPPGFAAEPSAPVDCNPVSTDPVSGAPVPAVATATLEEVPRADAQVDQIMASLGAEIGSDDEGEDLELSDLSDEENENAELNYT